MYKVKVVIDEAVEILQELKSLYIVAREEEPANFRTMPTGEATISNYNKLVKNAWKPMFKVLGHEFDSMNDAEKFLCDKGYLFSHKNNCGVNVFTHELLRKKYLNAWEMTKKIHSARIAFTEKLAEYVCSIGEPCYVRFGKIPNGGRSYNFRDNHYEQGVSVYDAVKIENFYVIHDVGNPFTFLGYMDSKKPIYVVSGDVCNECGSDDETLLSNVQIVHHIKSRDSVYTERKYTALLMEELLQTNIDEEIEL